MYPHNTHITQTYPHIPTHTHIHTLTKGWYCKADEAFIPLNQLYKDEDSGNMHVIESGHICEYINEVNYKFKLSKFQVLVYKHVHTHIQIHIHIHIYIHIHIHIHIHIPINYITYTLHSKPC